MMARFTPDDPARSHATMGDGIDLLPPAWQTGSLRRRADWVKTRLHAGRITAVIVLDARPLGQALENGTGFGRSFQRASRKLYSSQRHNSLDSLENHRL